MKEKNDAIKKLEEYDQQHILKIIENFSDEEKEEVYKQVERLDFDNLEKLYEEIKSKNFSKVELIHPISALKKDKIEKEVLESIESAGRKVIESNQFAVATMSGGQGTRLGYDKPKGMFKIDIKPESKYLFEIVCDSLKRENEKYGVIIPWYIMTSEENNDEIIAFFEDQNYFGYSKKDVMFFKQAQKPLIDENGKLLIGENKLIKEAADGNGGIFKAMAKFGCLDDMESRGVKWVFIGSIDNILLQMADPVLIGLAEKKNVQIATKSILKNSATERVGTICRLDDKIGVIEYSEIPEELAEAVDEDGEFIYGESHIMCNLFSLDILKKLAAVRLPYHKAYKKNAYINEKGELVKPETPNSYKFESFIFDSFNYVDDIAILRGDRKSDFAPVKNKEGVDSPATAIKLYNDYWGK